MYGARRVIEASVVLVAGLVALLAAIWLGQRGLIYFPSTAPVPPAASVLQRGEDIVLETQDGLRLGAWFFPAAAQPRATVLVCNGNAGDRSLRAPLAQALSRAGLAVLLFDYRGYGGNPGRPTEAGLLNDVRAARAYLGSRADVDPARVAYFGESLGGAVATALAAQEPPLALVLRSPFTSLADVGSHHYPFLPVRLLLLDRYPAADLIRRVRVPVLVLAGEGDRIVPSALSRALYELAPGPRRFVLVPDADHNDAVMLAGEPVIAEVVRFLDEVGGGGPGSS